MHLRGSQVGLAFAALMLAAGSISHAAAAPRFLPPLPDGLKRTFLTKKDLHLPPPPRLYPRSAGALRSEIVPGQTYTIFDDGAPNGAAFRNSTPLGFNNTGQIFGIANSSAAQRSGEGPECSVFTGKSFFTFTGSTSDFDCAPQSISDSNSSGTYLLGGGLQLVTDPYEGAFLARLVAGANSGSVRTFSSLLSDSQVYGVNDAGAAYGTAFDALFAYDTSYVPFAFSMSAPSLAPLQPGCAGAQGANECLAIPDWFTACPFGGCVVNGNGLVLGVDTGSQNGVFELYDPATATGRDIPDQFTDASGYSNLLMVPQMSNYGLVASDEILISPKVVTFTFAIDAFGSSGWKQIPNPAGCSGSNPLSMNNYGEVLFYAACTDNALTYFTWDPTNGTQAVNFPETGTYTYAYPLGVNDHGQILAQLSGGSSAGFDWGTLNPNASGNPARNRKQPSDMRRL